MAAARRTVGRLGAWACLLLLIASGAARAEVPRQRSTPFRDYQQVVFADRNTGWVADDAELLATSDAGRTWRIVLGPYGRGTAASVSIADLTVFPPAGVLFRDRTPPAPALYRSVDGGATWTFSWLRLSPAGPASASTLVEVQFITAAEGWGLLESRKTLWHTRSGAQSWGPLAPGPPGSDGAIAAFFFLDAARGWLVRAEGAGHRVWASTTGGRTWQAAGTIAVMPGSFLWRLRFRDPGTGWALERGPGGEGLHRTTDGGRTWSRSGFGVERPDQLVERVQFVDRLHGWAVGGAGLVLRTSDGGQTWQRVRQPARADLNGLWFLTRAEGWVVGNNSAILRTTDGGETWTPVGDDLQPPGRRPWDRLLGR